MLPGVCSGAPVGRSAGSAGAERTGQPASGCLAGTAERHQATRTGQLPRKGGDRNRASQALVPGEPDILADEDGQGLAEYALILALIAIVAIVALIFLGSQISGRLSEVGTAL